MKKDISKNAKRTTLDTNSDPNPDPAPTHINFILKKTGVFFVEITGRPH